MAINTDPRQTTAYYGNRTERRSVAGPVGRSMSAKQRDFVATLVTQSQDSLRAMLAATEPRGAVTAEMIAEALTDFSPATTVRAIQQELNRTDVTARVLIDSLVASRDALRKRAQEITRKAAAPAQERAEDGATYRAPNGSIFHAYKTQRGILCLKLWVATGELDDNGKAVGAFEWYGAAVRLPRDSVKMTREDAAEFGKATGTCCVCMRHLTNDESVAAGIGPVCVSKF